MDEDSNNKVATDHPFKQKKKKVQVSVTDLEQYIEKFGSEGTCLNAKTQRKLKCTCCQACCSSKSIIAQSLLDYWQTTSIQQEKFVMEQIQFAKLYRENNNNNKQCYCIADGIYVCSNTFLNLHCLSYDLHLALKNHLSDHGIDTPRLDSEKAKAEGSIRDFVSMVNVIGGVEQYGSDRKLYEHWAYLQGWESLENNPHPDLPKHFKTSKDFDVKLDICSRKSFIEVWDDWYNWEQISGESMQAEHEEYVAKQVAKRLKRNEARRVKYHNNTNIFAFGMTHPFTKGQVNDNVVKKLLKFGKLGEIQARDLLRLKLLQQMGHTVHTSTIAHATDIKFSNQSHICSWNCPDEVIQAITLGGRRPNIKFEYIILDYCWLQKGWIPSKMSLKFFETLAKLEPHLEDDGKIVLPFHSDIFKLLASKTSDDIGSGYRILTGYDNTFNAKKTDDHRYKVRYSTNLGDNPLWVATDKIEEKFMIQYLGKEQGQERVHSGIPANGYKEYIDCHKHIIPNLPEQSIIEEYRWIIIEKERK